MQPPEITHLLKQNENNIFALFAERPASFWEVQPEGKWSAGQHIIHLVQSTSPLLKALKLPNLILKWRFGSSNRPSRSYSEVVKKYEEKLAAAPPGIVGPFSVNMPASTSSESKQWMSKLSDLNKKLNAVTLKLKDKELDTILLPHPLMGRMTLREILMWNAYHTEHHINILNQKYTSQHA